jgi:hypothetical protein
MTVEFTPPARYDSVEYTFRYECDTGPVIGHDLRPGDRFRVMCVIVTEHRGTTSKRGTLTPSTVTVRIRGLRLRKKDGGTDRRCGPGWIDNKKYEASVARVFRTKCRRVDPNEGILAVPTDLDELIRQNHGPLGGTRVSVPPTPAPSPSVCPARSSYNSASTTRRLRSPTGWNGWVTWRPRRGTSSEYDRRRRGH